MSQGCRVLGHYFHGVIFTRVEVFMVSAHALITLSELGGLGISVSRLRVH